MLIRLLSRGAVSSLQERIAGAPYRCRRQGPGDGRGRAEGAGVSVGRPVGADERRLDRPPRLALRAN